MKRAQSIKRIKTRFILLSVVGLIFLVGCSIFTLNLHEHELRGQEFYQEYGSLLREQLRGVQNLDFTKENISSLEQIEKLRDLNSIQKSIDEKINDDESFLINATEHISRVDSFHKSINTYIENSLRGKRTEGQLQEEWREVEISLDRILFDIETMRQNARRKIRLVGWSFVCLCVVLVILIWLFVFKPLFETVFNQNERITAYAEEVKAASVAKENFLMNISHEIRTPMTAILGYADLIQNNDVEVEKIPQTIGIIGKNANHLLTLIDEILDLSKVTTDKFDYDIEKVDLLQLVNEVFSLMKAKALSKGIDLKLVGKTLVPHFINTDETRLKQVLMNIVGNAIKFTEEGVVTLRVEECGDFLHFEIEDEGPGVSDKDRDLIFRPFEQADNGSSRRHQGTGLGLVLARELSVGLGGNVTIKDTQVGKGSTFLVKIKTYNANDVERTAITTNVKEIDAEGSKKPNYDLSGKTIMVVDDAKENTRLFRIYLEKAGAEVVTASSGAEALREYEKEKDKVGLVFLDLQMPDMDGFETFGKLKEMNIGVPVVALTAHGMSSEKAKTKKAGFTKHVLKPISSKDLTKVAYGLVN